MKNKKITKIFFGTLAILLVAYILYVAFDIYFYGNIDETTNADVAIILGAGIWDSEPSPVFKERINHGIWLYECRYVDKLIFTGGKGVDNKFSDSFIARKYAVEQGIPYKDIFIEEQSKITQENLFYSSRIMRSNDISTAIIVSDPLHMKRSMLMAKDIGITAYSSPTPTSKYTKLSTKLPFLAREIFFYIGYRIFGSFVTLK